MDKHPIFKHQVEGAGQNCFLHIAAASDHILNIVAMIHRHSALRNDRTFIQILRGEMGCSADDFDSPLVCLPIRIRPCKRGKEGMMDIDNTVLISIDETARKDAHIFRHHNKIEVVLLDRIDY